MVVMTTAMAGSRSMPTSLPWMSAAARRFTAATRLALGSTGLADGVHLHFELRSDEFNRVNPFDFLN